METATDTTRDVAERTVDGGAVWFGKRWRLELCDDGVAVKTRADTLVVAAQDVGRIQISRRWFRYRFIQDGRSRATLRGLRRSSALTINEAIHKVRFAREISRAVAWHQSLLGELENGERSQRWIPREKVEALILEHDGATCVRATALLARHDGVRRCDPVLQQLRHRYRS